MIKVDSETTEIMYEKIAAAVFEELGLEGEAVCELDFTDAETIREVNATTRGIDKATDVLSFPMLDKIEAFNADNYPFDTDGEGAVRLGNILICTEVAQAAAEEYGLTMRREFGYLFAHGLLHLLGYDHETEADKRVMREKEEAVLLRAEVE